MRERKVLAVDVDLTVVDSVRPWIEWYKDLTGEELEEISSENNNLEVMMHQHHDPLSYWKSGILYDKLQAFPEATTSLRNLSDHLDIIFVSACMPEHELSKKLFLKRNFPFMKGFISTHDKHFTRCDYFVDDYKKYCTQLHECGVKVYQIKTSINSSSDMYPYMNWSEIEKDILKDLHE